MIAKVKNLKYVKLRLLGRTNCLKNYCNFIIFNI